MLIRDLCHIYVVIFDTDVEYVGEIHKTKRYIDNLLRLLYLPGAHTPQSSPRIPLAPLEPDTPGQPSGPGKPGVPGRPRSPGGPRILMPFPGKPFSPVQRLYSLVINLRKQFSENKIFRMILIDLMTIDKLNCYTCQ